ncbi:MAG: putative sensor domain DACNV-containing protein [Vicinamibacterales bacterium]
MEYVFPGTLADEVTLRWQAFAPRPDGSGPPLPAPAQLRHLLETAFYASLEREEGRDLRFVLCCTASAEILRDGSGEAVPVAPLVTPRPLSVEAIRALAPAVSPANAAILVRWSPDRADADVCEIAGILHVGAHLARARSGRSFHYRPAPSALVIDVREAGELHGYQGRV